MIKIKRKSASYIVWGLRYFYLRTYYIINKHKVFSVSSIDLHTRTIRILKI